jgi:hypothetical protein
MALPRRYQRPSANLQNDLAEWLLEHRTCVGVRPACVAEIADRMIAQGLVGRDAAGNVQSLVANTDLVGCVTLVRAAAAYLFDGDGD